MPEVVKNLLSDYGYNLVKLPKEDIAPLLLLYKIAGGVSSLDSPVQKLFKTVDVAPPTIIKDKIVTDIQDAGNIAFDAEAGLSMLDWLLQKLQMGKLAGKLKLDATNTVNICYEHITEDKVSLLDLDSFISGSEPDTTRFDTFKPKLENSELFVVNAVLKSNSFSIMVTDANGQQVNVDATIKGIVDASVDVSHNKTNAITLKHNDGVPLIFAFKAQQIIYNHREWWQFYKPEEAKFRLQDQQGVVLKSEIALPTIPLAAGDTLVDI